MRTLTYTVDSCREGCTVGQLLGEELMLSKSRIKRLKRQEAGVLLNGARAFTTARVRAGDVLCIEAGDPPRERPVPPAVMPLEIVFEDEDLLIVAKPAGIAVHADSRRPDEVTMENALSAYLGQYATAHPVSRLDRGTTGLMCYAKSGYIHERLRRMMHTPAFRKEYLGVAFRPPDPPAGEITLPIGFAEGSRYQRAIDAGGAPARTGYETRLLAPDGTALIRLIPHTGRTHQLRLHLAAIGAPLAGDWLYGERDARIGRPALHSAELWLSHPMTGQTLHLHCPLPEDMRALLSRR